MGAGLARHFAVEEPHLLPPVRAAGGDALASRTERDHAAIRNCVLSGPFDEPGLRQFAERLSAHVRFEERELFPFADQAGAGRYRHCRHHVGLVQRLVMQATAADSSISIHAQSSALFDLYRKGLEVNR